jgi:catechol 2,3-dioxygenase-like lactoylglutathione lyase family enzyme
MEKSKRFYYEVLGLEVIVDFGANVTLTGVIVLQTKDTWLTFINKQDSEIVFGGNAAELYMENKMFTGFGTGNFSETEAGGTKKEVG